MRNPIWKDKKFMKKYRNTHNLLIKVQGIPFSCENCGKEQGIKNGRRVVEWTSLAAVFTTDIAKYIGLCSKCNYEQDSAKYR